MTIDRRHFLINGTVGAACFTAPVAQAQSGKTRGRKIVLGQSVPLTGAADQIGLAYLNGAKMYFDLVNQKNGVSGVKIEVRTLDDGYNAAKAAVNAVTFVNEGVDALFGFVGTASCDELMPPPSRKRRCFLRRSGRQTHCVRLPSPTFSTCGRVLLTKPTKSSGIAPH